MKPPLQVLSCSEGPRCKNSVESRGDGARCVQCRFSPGNESLSHHQWRPLNPRDRVPHPVIFKEKRAESHARAKRNREQRLSVDPARQRLSRIAAKAEQQTQDNIIKATKNSGRILSDGDHTLDGCISLDTKLQSRNIHPVVRLNELDKIRKDAERNHKLLGGLLIRNSNGVGVFVIREEDLPVLISLSKVESPATCPWMK